MNKIITFSIGLLLAVTVHAQDYQSVSTGAGYQKQSFSRLADDAEFQVSNTAWDIAFTVSGEQEAGIFVNESSGSSMGQPLPEVILYDALTDDFNEQPDPALLLDYRLYNSEQTWSFGAFNEVRDPGNDLDFGWGLLDEQNNQIIGNRVYVLQLRNGQYLKLKIESLSGDVFTFKYADLDGSNETTATIDKSTYDGKLMAYFSFGSGSTVAVEPEGGFDLFYCRYVASIYDPGLELKVPYNVTGMLSGPGVQVAEADGVDPETVSYTDYQDSLRSELDIIGHDWKFFSDSWSLDADRVFFVKTTAGHAWKIHFIEFEGSTSGTAIFEKTDLGLVSTIPSPSANNWEAGIFPNPVRDELTVLLDIPFETAKNAQLEVVDIQGHILYKKQLSLKPGFQVYQLPTSSWTPGIYVLRIVLEEQVITLGKAVK